MKHGNGNALTLFILDGSGRKRKGTIEDFLDDEDEDGSDFEGAVQSDVELEVDDDASDDEEDSKPKAKEKEKPQDTPKKKARAKKIKEIKENKEEVDDLTDQLSKMTLQKGSYSMAIMCPYIMHDYVEQGRKLVSVDFLVPNQHRRFFRLSIVDNKILELKIIIPKTFCNAGRMMAANADKKKFSKDTHKATAFSEKCKEVVKEMGVAVKIDHDTGEEEIEVSSGVQQIVLPFEVEEDLCRGKKDEGDGYEVLGFENDDDVLFAELNEVSTHLFILSVDVASNEKKKKKKKKKKARGAMRKIKSPIKNYSNSSEEEDEDAYEEGKMDDDA